MVNLDKVMYPATETTKGEVLSYYAQVAPVMIPLIGRRAVTRIRWPHGVEGPMFFEKNLPSGAPSWLPRVTVSSHGRDADAHPERDRLTYPLVLDLADLTYLVNLASLELHVHQWQVDTEGPPARTRTGSSSTSTPGPGRASPSARRSPCGSNRGSRRWVSGRPCRSPAAARACSCMPRCRESTPRTTSATLAQDLAQEMTKKHPDLVVWKMTKSLRPGKIFVDWSQNTAAKTTICPYSLRGKAAPYVAAPRTWEEVEEGAAGGRLAQLLFTEVLDRLDDLGDLAAATCSKTQEMTRFLQPPTRKGHPGYPRCPFRADYPTGVPPDPVESSRGSFDRGSVSLVVRLLDGGGDAPPVADLVAVGPCPRRGRPRGRGGSRCSTSRRQARRPVVRRPPDRRAWPIHVANSSRSFPAFLSLRSIS